MVSSSLLSLSATFSHFHFIPKLSLPSTLSSVRGSARRNQRQVRSSPSSWQRPSSGPLLRSSALSFPTLREASADGDDLVVLGNDLVILGNETSCDDTVAAVVRGDGKILSQVVSSQDMLGNWSIKANAPGDNLFVAISVQYAKLGITSQLP